MDVSCFTSKKGLHYPSIRNKTSKTMFIVSIKQGQLCQTETAVCICMLNMFY